MYEFEDIYNNRVMLSFEDHPFSRDPKHVWVICRYQNQWLLTSHKNRGMEFPGGKVEDGETADQGAIREVKEETGGHVSKLKYIGQYKVDGREKVIIKNVYFAVIDKLEKQSTYFETNGPVLMKEIPGNIRKDNRYSFIMKDDVLTHCLDKIKKSNSI
ncbi:nucleoside triphosphatase YtkD [Sutcliffiella horikoshii]|uniref:Nucleoside triphosphatase YtkD n=1 Tax=Sutcliffiella horikoshii TaxID=79883 RepID=A0A1Y0CSD2_9BACI|nr:MULTISPECIES: nucleoside triphosphatase YtkD [Bacillaceae]ART77725.1 nucleoside triphosphatase YtkD [Sutcliffiella horikoshii]TYS71450.1 nucleoside triphosphatase YtkD [Sutcliffiella horikoshii]